ncbi:M48 family metallopeptidase [Anoxybacteroides tepidamans]|uniref:M48 family metallopeptidase n=1 Tax=Anoxybacteroides tepidamans TaxID=265948 RepID=UPI0005582D1D|nr:M48 family metallopeptidase [Anoxybacillus tepidamans]
MTLSEKQLIHPNERRYFWLVTTLSVLTYISLAFSIVGLIIVLGLAALSLFMHALMIGMIRTNAVRLSKEQFPDVYAKVEELCDKMGLARVPDVYVMQSGGVLNAFATRFFGRNMVVLYSEIFELIEQDAHDELAFVIAHELAHIKRNHIGKSLFILPAMWIPGLAELYLRACEYTCDRFGAYYTNNEAGKNALTLLAIGKRLYKRVNREAYVQQIREEKGFFVWLSQILSTHPPLPKRIAEIDRFFAGEAIKRSWTKKLCVLGIFMAAAALIGASGYYGLKELSQTIEEGTDGIWDESADEASSETSPLIQAVVANNKAKVRALIDAGTDINETDNQGKTALHWAAQDGNIAIASLLLEAGADIEAADDDLAVTTPLITAASAGQAEMVAFLAHKGANIEAKDSEGMTALMYAAMNGHANAVQTLLQLGAKRDKADYSGMTALMYAIEFNQRKIASLLRE